ncbi:CLUMA_CG002405, isoform A [Clunio marinus]|uniref:CLUMA_CG002405, isoform A n=1 Tax=Clunio marinus TaxID=568069 RepID=A0A1J1HMS1_9DIPT|nr:CLUMA_CG002405, isoform A [Clunio marinus]
MDKRIEDDNAKLNLLRISLENGAKGLGVRLSKSSWDPYPFVSNVDNDSTAYENGIRIGDCILKVNGRDCLGRQIQDIAKQIHNRTDDDNNEVNLLLWRSNNSQQQGYQPQLLHNLVSDLINVFQLMECPICMEIPTSPSHTFQCVNGHIVCSNCRPKTLRCPMCRVQMGRGRCLVADKILRYLQTNSMIRIGTIGDVESLSSKIDEQKGQKASDVKPVENHKTTENLHVKLKLKTITFWKDA